jgi:hypothetical protein
VSSGFCGACTCRRRARTRTGSAWGCGRASPLAATRAPAPLRGCGGSMPHYQSRQGPRGESLLPKSLRCWWLLGQVRHAWPWRRLFSIASGLRARECCCGCGVDACRNAGAAEARDGGARKQQCSVYVWELGRVWGSGSRCRISEYKGAGESFEARLEQSGVPCARPRSSPSKTASLGAGRGVLQTCRRFHPPVCVDGYRSCDKLAAPLSVCSRHTNEATKMQQVSTLVHGSICPVGRQRGAGRSGPWLWRAVG